MECNYMSNKSGTCDKSRSVYRCIPPKSAAAWQHEQPLHRVQRWVQPGVGRAARSHCVRARAHALAHQTHAKNGPVRNNFVSGGSAWNASTCQTIAEHVSRAVPYADAFSQSRKQHGNTRNRYIAFNDGCNLGWTRRLEIDF